MGGIMTLTIGDRVHVGIETYTAGGTRKPAQDAIILAFEDRYQIGDFGPGWREIRARVYLRESREIVIVAIEHLTPLGTTEPE